MTIADLRALLFKSAWTKSELATGCKGIAALINVAEMAIRERDIVGQCSDELLGALEELEAVSDENGRE